MRDFTENQVTCHINHQKCRGCSCTSRRARLHLEEVNLLGQVTDMGPGAIAWQQRWESHIMDWPTMKPLHSIKCILNLFLHLSLFKLTSLHIVFLRNKGSLVSLSEVAVARLYNVRTYPMYQNKQQQKKPLTNNWLYGNYNWIQAFMLTLLVDVCPWAVLYLAIFAIIVGIQKVVVVVVAVDNIMPLDLTIWKDGRLPE